MAVTLVSTAGASNANSYCSLAAADAYHANHPYATDWTDHEGEDIQLQALIMATQVLDEQFDWAGDVSTSTQSLLWPRFGVVGRNGYLLPANAIPPELVRATAELARQLIVGDRTADSDIQTNDIKFLAVDSIQVQFGSVAAKVIPDRVAAMVSHLGRPTVSRAFGSTYRT